MVFSGGFVTISAHLLCVTRKSHAVRCAPRRWDPSDDEADKCGLLGAVTMDCIMPESTRVPHVAHSARACARACVHDVQWKRIKRRHGSKGLQYVEGVA